MGFRLHKAMVFLRVNKKKWNGSLCLFDFLFQAVQAKNNNV